MKHSKIIVLYIITNFIYIFTSIILICRQDASLLSTYSFVYHFILPYTAGCILLNQIFCPAAVSKFPTRQKFLQVHIMLDSVLAFLIASLLFFLFLIFRLVFHLPTDLIAVMNQYTRFIFAAIQFSLLSKIFYYSNVRFINQGGYMLSFILCALEVLGIVRFSKYIFPTSINLFFSWAICENTIYGYIIPVFLISFLIIILNFQISKKDFFNNAY